MTQDIKNLRNHFLDYITNFKFCSYKYTKLCLNSLLQAYVIDDLLILGFWQNFVQNSLQLDNCAKGTTVVLIFYIRNKEWLNTVGSRYF